MTALDATTSVPLFSLDEDLSVLDEPATVESAVVETALVEPVVIDAVVLEAVVIDAVVIDAVAVPVWCERLGVFDLETTGIDIETSRIVSAHVGILDSTGALVERWDWLADPGIEIPEQATAVHGISTERARAEGRPAGEVVAEIVAALNSLVARDIPITIYNAPYDLSLLNREALRHGVVPLADPSPVIDPLVLDKAVDRYRKGKRTLEVAALYYGVDLTDAHDAAADAVAAGRVAQAIAHRYRDEIAIEPAQLHLLQIGWFAEQAASFEDYMRRTRDPGFSASQAWPQR
ncbi:DNA polymerase-3 subunit epsilon [Glaciihabitans tibetensis]|uniref:DNA polymerase-3 subunit epsilon n=1 Tax=Glaciihabitans tibetensis TaxID=1266600 RepID=A0A2T0VJT7_9MICO|nr:DNA polymerase-3 subunit epsilon [Glaciihabitans tibetensis]